MHISAQCPAGRPRAPSGKRRLGLTLALVTVVLMGLPHTPAGAQPTLGTERFEFGVGVQAFTHFTSAVRLDSQTRGIGTRLRLETDVDMDERIRVARADLFYNINARHYIAFASYDIERTGTRRVERDVRFGDKIFTIGTGVTAALDEDVAKLAYGYNALVRPRATLGPSFGLHVMRLEAGMSLSNLPLAYDARTTAPLPVVGVRGSYRISERWRFRGALELFDIDVGDIDGLFRDLILTFEHDTFGRLGFGFGLNANSLDIESGDDDFRGIIDLSFRSAMVYFRGSFGPRAGGRE